MRPRLVETFSIGRKLDGGEFQLDVVEHIADEATVVRTRAHGAYSYAVHVQKAYREDLGRTKAHSVRSR
jgi:hypothetical protein